MFFFNLNLKIYLKFWNYLVMIILTIIITEWTFINYLKQHLEAHMYYLYI